MQNTERFNKKEMRKQMLMQWTWDKQWVPKLAPLALIADRHPWRDNDETIRETAKMPKGNILEAESSNLRGVEVLTNRNNEGET